MNTDNDISIITEGEPKLNLREILYKYFHNWKWFVVSIVLFLALAFTYIKVTTPIYQIETDLLIKQDKDGGGMDAGDDILKSLGLFSSDKIIDNEVEILKSYTLFEKVVNALGLDAFYYQSGPVRKFPIYGNLPFKAELLKANTKSYSDYLKIKLLSNGQILVNGKKGVLNYPVQTELGLVLITSKQVDPKYLNIEFDVKFNNLYTFYSSYSQTLSIVPATKDATVLIITYQDAVPKRGEDLLNRLVLEYNNAAVEDKNKVTASTLTFVEERLKTLAGELGNAETNVEKYKVANKIANIGAQGKEFMENVQQNDADLSKVKIQLSVLENLENYLRTSGDESTKLPSMLGIDDPTLLSLVNSLAEVRLKRESLLQTIPETNPVVHSFNDQITALKTAIEQSVQNLKSGLLVTQTQLANKNSSFNNTITTIPSKERGLMDVQRQQMIKDTLFSYLLQKREEQEMSLASNLADSRTVDIARSTALPVKPIIPLVIGVFFLLGLLVPISVIYVRGILNNKVTKRSDVERLTNAPILGEIAHADKSGGLLTVVKPRSMVAEQIRALRTNLQFVSAEYDHKVLLFTSCISGEGKSFISLNLGASLAMADKKVVVLEMDLRKPKLHIALDMNNDEGLSNYLISNASYKDFIREIPQLPGYFIITSGPIPPNPAELLTNGKMDILIKELLTEFDYVLIDAPPVGLVTDAQILSKYANATMFIIRHNYTLKSQVTLIDDLYRNNKFPNLNIVFNSIDYDSEYGYGYGYGYGGYSGGYYEENQSQTDSFKEIFKRKK